MKRFLAFFVVFFALIFSVNAQTAVVSSGGDFSGAAGTVSFTVGQVDYVFNDRDANGQLVNYSAWEGVQQVYPAVLHLYDTICPGEIYTENGFNLGPFSTPQLVLDSLLKHYVVAAMQNPNIHSVTPDTLYKLHLTVRDLHSYDAAHNIDLVAGSSIPSSYYHVLGNGSTGATFTVTPSNSEIAIIQIGNSFLYSPTPLTESGIYEVLFTTTGTGCPTTFTDIITVHDSLLCNITNVQNDNACNGRIGSVTATATGGSGNFTYLWSNGETTATISNLAAGDYTVTITDAVYGITTSAIATIGNMTLTLEPSADALILCPGDTTYLRMNAVSDNGVNSPRWRKDASDNSRFISNDRNEITRIIVNGTEGTTRTYTATIFDNSVPACSATATVQIQLQCNAPVSNDLTATITPTDAICYGGGGEMTISPVNGTAPYTLYIYEDGSPDEIVRGFNNVAEGAQVTANSLPAGSYVVVVTDGNGASTSSNVAISENAQIATTDNVSACESYTWNGVTYSLSGTYNATLRSQNGCDSLVTLNLTINQPTRSFIAETCTAATYLWTQNGVTYSQSGSYSDTLRGANSNGCDSIVTLNLTFTTGNINLTAQSTDIQCFGANTGTISATATDGAAPYQISVYESSDLTVSIRGFNNVAEAAQVTANSLPAGSYVVVVTDGNGASTSSNVAISENAQIATTDNVSACGSYTWNGVTYSLSGTYNATLRSQNGCDSLVTLNLTINQPTRSFIAETCTAATYLWTQNGVTYSQSGSYSDTLRGANSNGCDSIITLNLTFTTGNINLTAQSTDIQCFGANTGTISATATDGAAPYQISVYESSDLTVSIRGFNNVAEGAQVTANSLPAGSYVVVVTDGNGASTSSNVAISENAQIATTDNVSACESYTWNGVIYSLSGTYNATLRSQNGCDSLVTLNLTINQPTRSFIAETCTAATYLWTQNGVTYSQSGSYSDTLRGANSNGCDSIVTLNLTFTTGNINLTAQSTDIQCFGANTGTISATATDGAAPYQISVYESSDLTVSIRGFNNVAEGAQVTANSLPAGSYVVVVTDGNGATTSSNVAISENAQIATTDNVSACGSYTWNGVIYSLSGTYNATLRSQNGCDSLVTLNLTINQPTRSFIAETCTAATYLWTQNGVTYSQSGSYSDTLLGANSNGCDSIVTLNLTFTTGNINLTAQSTDIQCFGANTGTITASATDGAAPYQISVYESSDLTVSIRGFNNVAEAAQVTANSLPAGSYVVVVTDGNGATTSSNVAISENAQIATTDNVSACGSYTWNGVIYSLSGTYNATLRSQNGCDSLVTLNLTINQPTRSFIAETCTAATYLWTQNGVTYSQSGSYSDTLRGANSNGCDSIVTLNLTINHHTYSEMTVTECYEYRWAVNSETYRQSGDYQHIIPNAQGCDSIITLHLTINDPVIEHVTIFTNTAYHWDVTDETYKISGDYSTTFYNGAANGCDSTIILHLTIEPNNTGIGNNDGNVLSISAFPNPTHDFVEIHCDAELNIEEVQLFDIYGKLIKKERLSDAEHHKMNFETYANGVYLLRFSDGTKVVKTIKIVKN